MNIELRLPPPAQEELTRRAMAAGKDVESFVSELISESLGASPEVVQVDRSHDRWMAELQTWVDSQPKLDHFVDDRRETIYGDDA